MIRVHVKPKPYTLATSTLLVNKVMQKFGFIAWFHMPMFIVSTHLK